MKRRFYCILPTIFNLIMHSSFRRNLRYTVPGVSNCPSLDCCVVKEPCSTRKTFRYSQRKDEKFLQCCKRSASFSYLIRLLQTKESTFSFWNFGIAGSNYTKKKKATFKSLWGLYLIQESCTRMAIRLKEKYISLEGKAYIESYISL